MQANRGTPGRPSYRLGVLVGLTLGLGRAMYALQSASMDGTRTAWLAVISFACAMWTYHAEGMHFHAAPASGDGTRGKGGVLGAVSGTGIVTADAKSI